MPSFWTVVLIASTGMAVAEASFPATVDVTLVFPRNSTYDANTLLPVVFSLETPELVSALQAKLSYQLWDVDNPSASTSTWGNVLVQPTSNLPNTTYLAVDSLSELFGQAGSWKLIWTLATTNCSTDEVGGTMASDFSSNNQQHVVAFSTTTDGSGTTPDVAASAANTTCGSNNTAHAVSVSVTGTLDVLYNRPDFYYGDICAVQQLATSVTVPSSCAVSLDTAAVASISAAITSSACLAATPVISCPATTSTSSSAASGLRPSATSLFPAGVALAMVSVGFLLGTTL